MDRLALPDAGWFVIEGPERPMHVGGLMLFEPPPDAASSFVRDALANSSAPVTPPFDQKLARPYGRGGVFHWVTDDVDLEHHVRRLALPEPGRIRELLALVSQVQATPLDRHRPLWEAYLIEGIEDGRFAMYTKVHHGVLDGVAAMRQLTRTLTADPRARDRPPPWAVPVTAADVVDARGAGLGDLMGAAVRLLGATVHQLTSVLGSALALTEQVVRARVDATEVVPYQAPRSMLNTRLTSARRVVAQSYELSRITAVSQTLGVTVNDVMLAMCGAALRAYLDSHDALPDKPLIAMVPVSIRPEDGSDRGNALTMVLANLATHVADPVERLELVRSSMDRAKQRLKGMTKAELIDYAALLLAPLALGQLTRTAAGARPLFNVVISNVAGPGEAQYWNGARLTGVYPVSLLPDGYALNITQMSYDGSMGFGITADRRALPSVQRLIDHLEDGLRELEHAAGV